MRSSSGLAIGLVVGVVVGAGAMYLALERPWASAGASATVGRDAGVSDGGAGAVAKGKKKPRKRGGRGGGGAGAGGDVGDDQGEVGEETAPIELSEADRRMSWKGDSVARPPAALDMGGGGGDEEGGRALTPGEINATVSRDGGLQRCVEQALDGAPFTGEIVVQLLVDGSGDVTRARVQAPAFMHGNGVLACVRKAGKGLSFVGTGGYTVVTVPFPISY